MVELRGANKKDFDFLFYLKKSTLKPYVEKVWGWDEEIQLNLFIGKFLSEYVQILMQNNQNIGMIEIEETDSEILMHNIQILPKYQNKGTGTDILKALIKKAISLNKTVKIQVLKVNLRALRLYERLGFKKYNETETHFQLKI